MFTISGLNVEIGGQAPTIHDVAWNLSRIPRWAGATIHPWSVAQHSIMIERLAQRAGSTESVQLWALWHDAHEFATGDIPVPFKTTYQRFLQKQIQAWLMTDTLGVATPAKSSMRWVKELDKLCAVAEAQVLCHPLVAQQISPERGFGENTAINPHVIEALTDLLDLTQRDACDLFVRRTDELVTLITS